MGCDFYVFESWYAVVNKNGKRIRVDIYDSKIGDEETEREYFLLENMSESDKEEYMASFERTDKFIEAPFYIHRLLDNMENAITDPVEYYVREYYTDLRH